MQIRRKLLGIVGEEGDAASVLGANFAAGFVAGSLAAGATCPLDVAKTRRQIEVCTFFPTSFVFFCNKYSKEYCFCFNIPITCPLVHYLFNFLAIVYILFVSFLFILRINYIIFQKDTQKAMRMTTRQTLADIWRYVFHML